MLIATNLQEHSASQGVDIRRSHGGALAALGHVLAEEVERLVIPSSYPYHDPKPWGSHWDVDPLWSSQRLAVEHADATFRRDGKVRAIADHPMVRRHLRVCFSPKTETGNCSRCEKCIRTMIALAMCGRLDDCETFDRTVPIDAARERHVDREAAPRLDLRGVASRHRRSAIERRRERLIADSRGRPTWLYQRMRRWRRKAGASRLTRLWNRLFECVRRQAAVARQPGLGAWHDALSRAGARLGLRRELVVARGLGEQIVDLGDGACLVKLLDGGDLSRHAVERGFVELPLGIRLLGLRL